MYQAVALIAGEHSDEEELRIQRRRLRDCTNILELPDAEFVTNFRVSKEVFGHIFNEVNIHMKDTYRNTHLPPQLKLSTFLRFLATGSYQKSIGNESVSVMGQSTVAKVIAECLAIFDEHFCHKWVSMCRTEEKESEVKEQFFNKCGIPGIVGCVDGTHVRIKAPEPDCRHLYYNRKGFYSINVMAICDHEMVITFVDARHPGANHDSFVWKNRAAEQQLRFAYNNGKENTWVLGDSGYPLQPYLMTPYRTPSDGVQRRYNDKHCKARNVIERCFGVLKNSFRSIIGSRGLHYSAEKATQIVNAYCAIHNVCILYKNDLDLSPIEVEDAIQPSDEDLILEDFSITAANIRSQIANNL